MGEAQLTIAINTRTTQYYTGTNILFCTRSTYHFTFHLNHIAPQTDQLNHFAIRPIILRRLTKASNHVAFTTVPAAVHTTSNSKYT
jgi:hypothetical protein